MTQERKDTTKCEYCGGLIAEHLRCVRCGILMHKMLAEEYRCHNCGEFHGRVSESDPMKCWMCAEEKPLRHTRPVIVRQSIGNSWIANDEEEGEEQ